MSDRETEIKKGLAICHLFELFQGNTFHGIYRRLVYFFAVRFLSGFLLSNMKLSRSSEMLVRLWVC